MDKNSFSESYRDFTYEDLKVTKKSGLPPASETAVLLDNWKYKATVNTTTTTTKNNNKTCFLGAIVHSLCSIHF